MHWIFLKKNYMSTTHASNTHTIIFGVEDLSVIKAKIDHFLGLFIIGGMGICNSTLLVYWQHSKLQSRLLLQVDVCVCQRWCGSEHRWPTTIFLSAKTLTGSILWGGEERKLCWAKAWRQGREGKRLRKAVMVNCGGGRVISLVANLAKASDMDTHCIEGRGSTEELLVRGTQMWTLWSYIKSF